MKPTRQDEKNDPVNHQHGPEHGNIKDREPRAHKTNCDGPSSRFPELKLRKTADEGTELVVLLGGETGVAIFEALVLGEGGVELGLQEEEEEVKEIDS